MKTGKKSLLSLLDLSTDEINLVLDRAKEHENSGGHGEALKGLNFLLLFQNNSLRTRCSFDVAISDLGGHSTYFDWKTGNFNKADLEDETRVLSVYYDGIIVRMANHELLASMADVAKVPVINAMTDNFHPCQVLADVYTLREMGPANVTYLGPIANVSNSLAIAADKLGINLKLCVPEDSELAPELPQVEICHDPKQAVKDADVLYLDSWVGISNTQDPQAIIEKCKPYQLNQELLSHTSKPVKIMHCMPIKYGHEIDDAVTDHVEMIHLKQAANRVHVQKALLEYLYGR